MSVQRGRRPATIYGRGIRSLAAPLCLALAAALSAPSAALADVVGIGDIFPFKPDPDDPNTPPANIPDLPQFGSPPNRDLIIVGGTNHFVGGTSTGQMIIDIPSDTNPLLSVDGYIGGNTLGLGSVNVVGLNSEWRLSNSLTAGWEGQAFLEIAAGGRVQVLRAGIDGEPGLNDSDYTEWDLLFGAWEGSQGFAQIDGFASLLVGGNMSVGHRGQGRIDMTNGSRIITINRAVVGAVYDVDSDENAIGNGYVMVDGAGSRWNVGVTPTSAPPLPGGGTPPAEDNFDGLLIIGAQGRGTVEILNKGWVRVETDTILGDEAGAFGKAVINGADSLLWSLENMFVGNAAGTATGELHIDALGEARADGDGPAGGVFVGPLGLVEFGGGTLIAPNLASAGVIRGDGRVESPTVVNTGDIRNAAGLANIRERLVFTGLVTNTSNIESIGGEMEFQELVTHDGPDADVVAIDAILRFRGGLTSVNGARIFLEDSVVWMPEGEVLASAGSLSLWAGESTLAGNLELAATNRLNVTLGDDYGRLEVTGDATLGGLVNVSLRDDYLPKIGDAFEIIDASSLTGTFTTVSGGAGGAGFWQASYTGTSAILSYVADVVSTLLADFDGNGVVDGGDLAVWQMNMGKSPATMAEGDANGDGVVDGQDWIIWQREVGSMAATAAATPATGAVPEPNGLALAALALLGLAQFRQRAG
jgi:T5SS/PEP-CTERM-associated repeat protein